MPTTLNNGSSAFVVKDSSFSKYPNPASDLIVRRGVQESSPAYGKSKRPLGPEAILHKAWRNAGLEQAQVRGRDGHIYSIVYGGKPGGSLGPDFTDAVIKRDDGVMFRGDIEIHVRESDWRAHGHHTDPRYNGVVLHVVAAESNGKPALKATGSSIPLLALNWKRSNGRSKRIDHSSAEIETNQPHPNLESPPKIKLQLDLTSAGVERFHSQAAGIALDIEAFGADQALWLGVLGALGYPRNKRAFRAVGTHATWSVVSACEKSSEVEELLLHSSGLALPASDHQRNRLHLRANPPKWVKPFGRPANSPQARIKAISTLIRIWTDSEGIAKFAENLVQPAGTPKHLQEMFRPTELIADNETKLLGAARAAEIVVNVLLPTVFALTTQTSEVHSESIHLKNKTLSLYNSHPKLPENSVTKEAVIALSIDHALPKISSACDQQGLIALYREMFRHGIRPRQPRLPGV